MMEEMKELAVNDAVSYGLPMDDSSVTVRRRPMSRLVIGGVLVTVVVAIVLGFLIGWFARGKGTHKVYKLIPERLVQDSRLDTGISEILKNLNKDNIRENLRNYTSKPRLAGTQTDQELVSILADQWKQNGLDSVDTPGYDVLLSFPNITNPNKIEIVTDLGEETGIVSAPVEKPLDEEGKNPDIVPPYNSFAPNATVEGDLVYVNYGTIDDFLYLTSNLSMNLTGKIAIARYGKIFRGDKVENAQDAGMIGIVMYTDPSDFNIGNTNNTYPDSWWMPDTGVQRGTVGTDGDYLTPLYPATDYAYRKKIKDVLNIKIPSHPISYGDAYKFLRRLGGNRAPDTWQGKLNITYNLGPGFSNTSLKARLTVNNYMETRTIKNVIGYIRGQEEPDRYVLLGNHHDAWVFGAIDPLSGTAALTEVTRVMGDMLKKGHRPRRTIVFCTWGAEEVGLIGSTEWVEEHMKVLYERAVAYINVDYAADYHDYLVAGTSPLLQDPLYQAAKQVPDPSWQYTSLYDAWKSKNPMNKSDPNSEASVYYSLGSGSDMATFYQRAGVPSIDMWYSYDENRWDILSYPLYHSAYETFRMFSLYIDPTFNFTLATGQLWSILAWKLANENVLSFDVRRYSSAIDSFVKNLKDTFGKEWSLQQVNIEALESAAANFSKATADFYQTTQMNISDALSARILNDKMMKLERAFIDPEGLPGRPQYKHVMFAPSRYDSYLDNSFPGIVDTMFNIQHNNASAWELLKQQVSVATYTIQSAADTLENIGLTSM